MENAYVRTGGRGGGLDQCVRTAYRGEGGGGQKLANFCVRTLWMAPYFSRILKSLIKKTITTE